MRSVTEHVAAGLRVSDADREAVAGDLREHYAVGRLTLDELHERLDLVLTARTGADLDGVTADLPRLARAGSPRPDAGRWARYVRVNTICWSIWTVTVATTPTHSLQGLWPVWVSVPWGFALLNRRHEPSWPAIASEDAGAFDWRLARSVATRASRRRSR